MEKNKVQNDKVQKDDEISTEELEQVNGGVSSAEGLFLKIGDIKGESTKRVSYDGKIK